MIKKKFQTIIFNTLQSCHLLPSELIDVKELDFSRNVAKRLDEHRELVINIDKNTTLFNDCFWHVGHMSTQDDYLMKLFYLRHGQFPDEDNVWSKHGFVRNRPLILGPCKIKELT